MSPGLSHLLADDAFDTAQATRLRISLDST
jgi:hypothetical protein